MTSLTYAIVTPARNERDNLRRLADSVCGQTHLPAEWVIVDDGSDWINRWSAPAAAKSST